jgi:HSP20 family protein
MLAIDEAIENVEKLYQAVTGRPVPQTDGSYAPIPAEKDPAEHVEEQLSRLLSAVGTTVSGGEAARRESTFAPPLSIWEAEREVVFAFDVPGVKREDVEVLVQGHALTVRGTRPAGKEDAVLRASERASGPFFRAVPLPPGLDVGKPNASQKDGVLEVRIPKEPRPDAPKPIPVS